MTDSKTPADTGETLPGIDTSDWPEAVNVTHDVPDWLIPSRVYDIQRARHPRRRAHRRQRHQTTPRPRRMTRGCNNRAWMLKSA